MTAKKTLKFWALGSVLSLATLGHAMAETTFRFAASIPNRGARAEAIQFFADQLEAQSGGNMKLDIHWSGALLKYRAILGGVSSGAGRL